MSYRKIDLEIEKTVSEVFAKERAAIEEEIRGYAQDLLDAESVKDQVDGNIHDALTRLQGINQVFDSLKSELGKLYE